MNKKIYLLPLIAVVFLAQSNVSHAAFTLTKVLGNGDGRAFTTTSSPVYTEDGGFLYQNSICGDPISNYQCYVNMGSPTMSLDPATACRNAVARSGLSDTRDTYCVYDASEHAISVGSSFYGSGGATTGCEFNAQAGCTGNPPARGYGVWPPSSNNGYLPEEHVSVYQSTMQNRSLSEVLNTLDTYNAQLFTFQLNGGTRPTDPGYNDVCKYSHYDVKGTVIQTVNAIGPDAACDVYHHVGVAGEPVATLTANPTTVTSGSSSALTYSCSNGATSATIDQGIGAVTPASSGTRTTGALSATKTYTLTCTNAAGSDTDTATVTVTPTLTASCSVAPTTITAGGSARWTASASGGSGTFSYSWSGTDGLQGKTGNPVDVTYTTQGTKTGSVTVTSGTQSKTVACTNSLTVNPTTPTTLTCTVNNSTPDVGVEVTYTAAGGAVPYTWTASGGGSYGTAATAKRTFASAGTYTMTVSKSGYTSATCPTVTASVASNGPDLTASSITPTTATEEVSVTLSTTITNQGTASTGTTFTDLFQLDTDTNHTSGNESDIGTKANVVRAAGASNAATLPYTFANAGTFYVRACADKSSAGNGGVITESDETNNCGSWTKIVVAPASTPTLSCTVDNRTPAIGAQVTYTVPGGSGAGYTWTASDLGVLSRTASNVSRTFDTSGDYGMTVSKNGFTSGNCPVVTVGTPSCGIASIGSFAADKTRVRPGESVHLTWSASGVDTSCVVTGPGVNRPKTPTSCSASDSFDTPGITTQSTYTLDCDDGEDTETVIVNVVPVFDEF